MPAYLRMNRVSFRYPGAVEPLFEDLSFGVSSGSAGAGWTAVVGPNGAGKTTLIRLITGELRPDAGSVDGAAGLYCSQETEHPPAQLEEFMNDWDGPALTLKDVLAIDYEWLFRWDGLSHGERKRLQLATALWQAPSLLAVDEPTNHLDVHAREVVARALSRFEGPGFLVSHDRTLLDRLCTRTLVVAAGGAELRPGNLSAALRQEEIDVETARRQRQRARQQAAHVRREYQRRAAAARSIRNGYSKRNLDPRDHAGRYDIDVSRITGKDARAGQLKRQLEARLTHAEEAVQEAQLRGRILSAQADLSLFGRRHAGDFLLRVPAGALLLGGERRLQYPELEVRPGDRIHLGGRNGAGKSTLLRELLKHAPPGDETLFLPQEFTPEQRRRLKQHLDTLTNDQWGQVLAAVKHLGSEPERIRESHRYSPGEERKLLLALGVVTSPALLVLDEPTNHLDLPSILALEQALSGQDAALILVSHDERFIRELTRRSWRIAPDGRVYLNSSV